MSKGSIVPWDGFGGPIEVVRVENVAMQYKYTNEIIDLGLNISLIANSFLKSTAVH